MKNQFYIFLIALFSMTSCSSPPVQCNDSNSDQCIKVLFIGNSYTYVNDLPQVLSLLAKSGGHLLETGMSAQGGWTLKDHFDNLETKNLIANNHWNYVVLQEQSEIPAIQNSRSVYMYPAVRGLTQIIRGANATPLLFETWGHKDGVPQYGISDYPTMQDNIDVGYEAIAQELNVQVSPVGYAWMLTTEKYPQIELWQSDGSHPSVNGTYLAACVFYAVIFRESPVGLSYADQVSGETASNLQLIAKEVVLGN